MGRRTVLINLLQSSLCQRPYGIGSGTDTDTKSVAKKLKRKEDFHFANTLPSFL